MTASLLWQRRWFWLLVLSLGVLLFVAAAAIGPGYIYFGLAKKTPVPMSDRQQRADLSPETMQALSDQLFNRYRGDQARQLGTLQARRLQRVAKRLIDRAPAAPGGWRFELLSAAGSNLRLFPDGRILVESGLFRYFESDAELAALLAHAMAHVIAKHQNERLSERRMNEQARLYAQDPEQLPSHERESIEQITGMKPAEEVTEPYNRELEGEADRIAQTLMAWACYDPKAAAVVWHWLRPETVLEQAESSPADLLKLHPDHQARVWAMGRSGRDAFNLQLGACKSVDGAVRGLAVPLGN